MSRKDTLFIRIDEPHNKILYNKYGGWKKVVVICDNTNCLRPWQTEKKFTIWKPGEYTLKADDPWWLLENPIVNVDDEKYWKEKFEQYSTIHLHRWTPFISYPNADHSVTNAADFDKTIQTNVNRVLIGNSDEAKKMFNDEEMMGFDVAGYYITWDNEIPIHWGEAWKNFDAPGNWDTLKLDTGSYSIIRDWTFNEGIKTRHTYYCGINFTFNWTINVEKINKKKIDEFAWLRVPLTFLRKGEILITLKKIDTLVDPEYTIRGIYRGEEDDENTGFEFGQRNWYWARDTLFQDNKCELRISGSGEKTLMVFYPTNIIETEYSDIYGKLDKDAYTIDLDLLPLPDLNTEKTIEELREQINIVGSKQTLEKGWAEKGYDIKQWCEENGINWENIP